MSSRARRVIAQLDVAQFSILKRNEVKWQERTNRVKILDCPARFRQKPSTERLQRAARTSLR